MTAKNFTKYIPIRIQNRKYRIEMLPIEVVAVLIPKLFPPTLFLMLERNLCDNELFTLVHVKQLLYDRDIVNEFYVVWNLSSSPEPKSIANFFNAWNRKYLFRDTPLEYVQKQWFAIYNVLMEECLEDACEYDRSDFIDWIVEKEKLYLHKVFIDILRAHYGSDENETVCNPKMLFRRLISRSEVAEVRQDIFNDPEILQMMGKIIIFVFTFSKH
jgi:hypothetical protein